MTAYFKNVKINISVYFAAALALLCVMSKDGYASLGLVCCVLHEIGHLIVLKLAGGKVKSISLGVYGMRIDVLPDIKLSFFKSALISLGGPMMNLLLVLLGCLIKNQMLLNTNLVLMLFNLLPIESMDGYNVIFNLLLIKCDTEKLKTALKIISAVFLSILYFFSFLLLFKTGYNFTLLAVTVYLTVKFVFQGI